MAKLLLLLLSVSALLLAWPAAGAQPVIVWALVEGPPEHLRPEARRLSELGQGPQDETLRLLGQALPGIEHRVQHMPLEQVWRDMRLGRPVCFADAFKTAERLAVAHFVELGPSARMLVLAQPGRLPPGEEVSLRELLAAGKLRGAFERQRSYGAPLDALLDEFQQPRQLLPSDERLLRMLEHGRMDYVLETPNGWLQRVDAQLDTRLVLEGRQPPPVHVACSRTMNLQLVRAIDGAVRQLGQQERWLRLKLLAYPPSQREAMRPQIEQYLRQRAEQGERIE